MKGSIINVYIRSPASYSESSEVNLTRAAFSAVVA